MFNELARVDNFKELKDKFEKTLIWFRRRTYQLKDPVNDERENVLRFIKEVCDPLDEVWLKLSKEEQAKSSEKEGEDGVY